jgi:hypothetical protein
VGPVALNVIDESTGQYWLGDNYTKEIGAWATFPGKATPWKTSFLPSEELANKWKMAGAPLPTSIKIDEGGVCTTCYKHPDSEPAWNPPAGGPPTTPPPPADAGAPGDSPDAATPPPPTTVDAGGGTSVTPPPKPEPKPDPEPAEDAGAATASRSSGGCSFGQGGASPLAALVLIALFWARRRARS